MKCHLEFHSGSSAKFWTIEVDASEHTVRYGKLGTKGQSKTKCFDSAAEAQASAEKLIASKKKKGYLPAADSPAETEAPAKKAAPANGSEEKPKASAPKPSPASTDAAEPNASPLSEADAALRERLLSADEDLRIAAMLEFGDAENPAALLPAFAASILYCTDSKAKSKAKKLFAAAAPDAVSAVLSKDRRHYDDIENWKKFAKAIEAYGQAGLDTAELLACMYRVASDLGRATFPSVATAFPSKALFELLRNEYEVVFVEVDRFPEHFELLRSVQAIRFFECKFQEVPEFEGSFQEVEFSDMRLKNLDFLPGAQLKRLVLTTVIAKDISALAKATSLESLSLDLRDNRRKPPEPSKKPLDLSFLQNLTSLKTLELAGPKVTDVSAIEGFERQGHVWVRS